MSVFSNIASIISPKRSTLFSGKPNRFYTTDVSSRILSTSQPSVIRVCMNTFIRGLSQDRDTGSVGPPPWRYIATGTFCHSNKTVTLNNLHRLIGHSIKILAKSQPPSSRILSRWLVLAFRLSWRIYTRSKPRARKNIRRFCACWMLVLGVVSQLG